MPEHQCGYCDETGACTGNCIDDTPDDSCPNSPDGLHDFACTGTAYGGDDERWCGEGRSYCTWCGADGDA